MKFKLHILIILLNLMPLSLLFGEWRPLNFPSEGSSVNSIININNKLFSYSYESGIYISLDEGANWNKITNGRDEFLYVNQLGTDGVSLLAFTDYNGLFKTTDDGQTWTAIKVFYKDSLIKLSYPFKAFKIIKYKNNIIIPTNNALLYSTDNGNTWFSNLYNINNIKYFVDLTIGDNNTIYLSTDLGLYFSNDFGRNWNIEDYFKSLPVNIYKLFNFNDDIYACTESKIKSDTLKYIYKLEKNNPSWQLFKYNEFKDKYILNSYSDNYLYLSYFKNSPSFENGIIESNDNGTNWTQIYVDNSPFINIISNIAVTNNYIIANTSSKSIIRKNKQNNNWLEFSNFGIYNNNITSIKNINNRLFASTTQNGVYYSDNNGLSWSHLNNSPNDYEGKFLTINDLATNSKDLFIATNNGIYKSTDQGNSWTNLGLYNYPISKIIVNESQIYAYSNKLVNNQYESTFFLSNNSGLNWSIKAVNNNNQIFIYSISQINNELYFGTTNGLYYTSDYGVTWSYKGRNIINITLCVIQSNNQLLCGTENGLYYSSNNGQSWNFINNEISNLAIFKIISFDKYLIASTNYGIYLSSNQGLNWEEYNSGLKNFYILDLFTSNDIFYISIAGDKPHFAQINRLSKLRILNLNKTVFCPGEVFQIDYQLDEELNFSANNTIFAELSNSQGKFDSNSKIIASLNTYQKMGRISLQIPFDAIPSAQYRIRLKSNNPEIIGLDYFIDLTILSTEKPQINGEKIACQWNGYIYEVPPQIGYSLTWKSDNANIIGSYANNYVELIWTKLGKTKLILIRNSQSFCNDTLEIDVEVKPLPQAPKISVLDTTIISNSQYGNQWYYNGNILINDTNKIIIPLKSGYYKARIKNEFGCYSDFSDSVFFDIDRNKLKLEILPISGYPGDNLELKVKVIKNKSFNELGVNNISGAIVFNASLLYPVESEKGVIINGKRYLSFIADTNIIADNIIKIFKLKAMLGDSVGSILNFDNLKTNNPSVIISGNNSLFKLLGVCFEGGARLITSSAKLALLSIYPNPINDIANLMLYSNENTHTKLSIINNNGDKIKEVNCDLETGINKISIDCKDLPFGIYYIYSDVDNQYNSISFIRIRQ